MPPELPLFCNIAKMASPQELSHGASALAINFDSVDGLPVPKRRKTSVACELCRSRKAKCDGVRPSESVRQLRGTRELKGFSTQRADLAQGGGLQRRVPIF
jgi:hypothetical protein